MRSRQRNDLGDVEHGCPFYPRNLRAGNHQTAVRLCRRDGDGVLDLLARTILGLRPRRSMPRPNARAFEILDVIGGQGRRCHQREQERGMIHLGATSFNNSAHLPPAQPRYSTMMPVMLPPGCGKLETRPSPTGSVPEENTIGMVAVAFFAATAAAVLPGVTNVPARHPDQLGSHAGPASRYGRADPAPSEYRSRRSALRRNRRRRVPCGRRRAASTFSPW